VLLSGLNVINSKNMLLVNGDSRSEQFRVEFFLGTWARWFLPITARPLQHPQNKNKLGLSKNGPFKVSFQKLILNIF
jgi:hypothetical protein